MRSQHDAPGSGFHLTAGFTLAVLTFTFSIGFVDRQILNLLVEPIRADLRLSDVKISLLQGLAFSLPYLLMSPVFGRWVDVSARRNIIVLCVFTWTIFTMACGLAGGFAALLGARALVGAAEAGLTPAAWSMLSDRFDDQRLPRALSIYHLGTYLGSGLALLIGGMLISWSSSGALSHIPVIGALRPWQFTFVGVGSLGLLCIILVLCIPEPERAARQCGEHDQAVGIGQAVRVLKAHRAFYFPFYLGMSLAIAPVYVFPAWIPALVMRQYGVPIADVGLHYGIASLLGGSLGVLSGPTFARLLTRSGYHDVNVRIVVLSSLAVFICCIALALRINYFMVIVTGGIVAFFYAMPTPMAGSALQLVTPVRMRGLATGIYVVMITLMGLGLTPVAVAFLTESFFHDIMRVGDSVAIVCGVTSLACAATLMSALPAYRGLLARPIPAT